jgi:competence protein ComEA
MNLTRRDLAAIGLGTAGLAGMAAALWLLISSALPAPAASGHEADGLASPTSAAFASPGQVASGPLLVDMQGAVRRPGLVRLAPGSRIADALKAAGGYSRKADLNAAAGALNLAAVLADGAQVFVPMIGAPAPPPASVGGGGGTAGSLVNLNTATPEELEALPGIGPVTVQKIVAARAEQPFTTLDELVERQVIDRGQLEDIRDLVTL